MSHGKWLAELWQMIEECASSERRSFVTLTREGCAALLGQRREPNKCLEAVVAHNNAAVDLAHWRLTRINALEAEVARLRAERKETLQ